MSDIQTWLDEITTRLEAVKAELPYEDRDRHDNKSAAWSDLYQHAPTDLRRLIAEVERLETELANKETRSMSKIEDSKKAPIKFRKRPVKVEAMRFAGTTAETMEVYRWIEENTSGSYDTNDPSGEVPGSGVSIDASTGFLVIATLEGEMIAKPGDWIIRGVAGEFYPCKPEIFAATYEILQP